MKITDFSQFLLPLSRAQCGWGANHALQRTAPCVTAPASAAAFPPTAQVSRGTGRFAELGGVGASSRLLKS
jgi:hypothetical protein